MFAAVPKAKLTGPCSPLTTIVLPGSYVVTVPVSYVVLVVLSVVVVGLFVVVVSSVVVVLVCANANGAAKPQTKAIIVFFTLMPPCRLGLPHNSGLTARTDAPSWKYLEPGDLSARREFANVQHK